MEMIDKPLRKRKPTDEQEARETLHKFLISKKRGTVENNNKTNSNIRYNRKRSKNHNAALKMGPLQLQLPTMQLNAEEMNFRLQTFQQQAQRDAFARHQAYIQSIYDEDEEPQKLFTLYDIKNDETSKTALDAKRRLRFTNIHSLIVPEEKLFLITCCDHFLALYEDLIDYVVAIGQLRNKQIIVEHYYYKLFMHTLKMFYYTDKGWRFEVDMDEFFSGFLRKYREPIIGKMRDAWNKAKAQREANKKVVEVIDNVTKS
uniref:Uncharacterized protein n=2 Tax=Caenorhabditis japonica TaxID=281687 RepID=A0A8R1DY66_CAEJA